MPSSAQPTRRASLFAMLLLASSAALLSLGAAPRDAMAATASEARSVGEFDEIAVRGSIKLILSQGAERSVQVQADEKLLPQLETVVEGRRLKVGLSRGWRSWGDGPVTVTVVAPQLKAVALAGSGDVIINGFQSPRLALAVSGSGDVRASGLQVEELELSISGSGDAVASGTAAKLGVRIAGSGDVRTGELKADDVSVRIAGSGDAVVHAEKTLRVSIAGSGDVRYSGTPEITQSVAGSGSVRKR